MATETSKTFGCTNCGADLKYAPGSTHLKCDYCGTKNEIPQIADAVIDELNFEEFLEGKKADADPMKVQTVSCGNCGATTTVDSKIASTSCPYCSTPLIAGDATEETIIKPGSLLPFKLTKDQGLQAFRRWIKRLWFKPSALSKQALTFDHFNGVYLPFFTYDSATSTRYTGQRGEHYYVTESYTTTENGKTVTKTRQVQRTRWYSVSGRVKHSFDDILICASRSVSEKKINALEPWGLQDLVPFDPQYLSGYTTEKYQVDLKSGFVKAEEVMKPHITQLIHRDIGGDVQHIHSMHISYSNITFKHLLLPTYVSAYRFKGKLYQFVINARTGEVQGERPWSYGKIALAVLGGIALIALILWLANQQGG
jgi:LSD1 subclass zinc finger protein